MIADLKPYAEYKESGLSTLGKVPAHWELRQARQIGRFIKGVGGTKEDSVPEGVPCVRYGELYTTFTYFIRTSKAFIKTGRAADYLPIQYGDVLFAASGEKIEEIGKSAVNLMNVTAVCGGDVIVLRPSVPVHGPFLGYAMDCRPAAIQKATMGRGTTIKHIYPDELRSLLFPLPTLDEQEAIVRFLDWANGRLERAIRAKRKVIALLNEQKQAIIHRAVTRGLDPSVPLKPSGIPWLGDIPLHWEMPLFGRLLRGVEQGWSPVGAEGEIALDQWTVLTLSSVRRGTFNPSEIKPVSRKATIPSGIEIHDGDILLTRSNTRDRVGDVCIVRNARNRTILCDLIYRLRVRDSEIVPEFLVYQLLSRVGRAQIEQDARGSSGTMPKISQRHIKSWRILLPPTNEQMDIVHRIDADCAPMLSAISRLEREIDLLREYRTRLVADVVTGKLDVRDAAAKLPVEEQAIEPGELVEDDSAMMEDEITEPVG